MLWLRTLVVFGLGAVLATPVTAAEVEVQYVTEKMRPQSYLPVTSEAEAIKQYGKEFGKQMWEMAQASMRPSYHVFLLNRDTESKVTRVELQLRFLDAGGDLIEKRTEGVQILIPPGESMEHIVWCADPACDASEKLEVAVVDTIMVNLRPKVVIAGNEFRFEWDGRTWYVEDLWAEEKTLMVRSFAASAYEQRVFDDRVFAEGTLEAGKNRFYRIASEPIKALRVSSDELELEPYKDGPMWYMDGLPGIKIENGARVKPGLLELGLNNVTYDLELEPDSYVKILDTSVGKKYFDLLIGPVCRTVPRHSRVRAMVRFAVGKQGMSSLDSEAADALVRPWLAPVSIAEVARTCGPNSGTLVKRWSDMTTLADVERELGTSEVRAETADGEVVVYGDLRLIFTEGRLAGCERRGSS
jgi:hypothetical protein